MVVLPYKDRLQLFAKYLQQLIMESIGKEKDLDGRTVNQGISVYGNKGATDQHAYVQQLRDGVNNFFATFIEVLEDRAGHSVEVESGVTSGDYLSSYLQGTRSALYENGRQSLTITIERLDARSVGALIALYERAVGYYASLVNINAYHQPGVEVRQEDRSDSSVSDFRTTGTCADSIRRSSPDSTSRRCSKTSLKDGRPMAECTCWQVSAPIRAGCSTGEYWHWP